MFLVGCSGEEQCCCPAAGTEDDEKRRNILAGVGLHAAALPPSEKLLACCEHCDTAAAPLRCRCLCGNGSRTGGRAHKGGGRQSWPIGWRDANLAQGGCDLRCREALLNRYMQHAKSDHKGQAI